MTPQLQKVNNYIGQTDHHWNAHNYKTRCSPSHSLQPYPLALKHHDILKQEIKNLLDEGIIHKSMSQWESPIVVVKKHTHEDLPQ